MKLNPMTRRRVARALALAGSLTAAGAGLAVAPAQDQPTESSTIVGSIVYQAPPGEMKTTAETNATYGSAPSPDAATRPRAESVDPGDLAVAAFDKLDIQGKGYVTREDASHLQGFDRAFREADANRDGQLDAAEFSHAWSLYTPPAR